MRSQSFLIGSKAIYLHTDKLPKATLYIEVPFDQDLAKEFANILGLHLRKGQIREDIKLRVKDEGNVTLEIDGTHPDAGYNESMASLLFEATKKFVLRELRPELDSGKNLSEALTAIKASYTKDSPRIVQANVSYALDPIERNIYEVLNQKFPLQIEESARQEKALAWGKIISDASDIFKTVDENRRSVVNVMNGVISKEFERPADDSLVKLLADKMGDAFTQSQALPKTSKRQR